MDKPSIWFGHIILSVQDLDASIKFYESIGMRFIESEDYIANLELRGGSHLILLKDPNAKPIDVQFDLMVDDLHQAHRDFEAHNCVVEDIVASNEIEDYFVLLDPMGNRIKINESHVNGRIV